MISVNASASASSASSISVFSNVLSRRQPGVSLRSVIDSGDREISVTDLIGINPEGNTAVCSANDDCRQPSGSAVFRERDSYDLCAETGDFSLRLYDKVLTAADYELCAE